MGDDAVDDVALDPADTDDVAQQVGADAVAGTVELEDGTEMPVALDGDIVDAARERDDIDLDDARAAAVPDDMDFAWTANAQQDDTATIPVQSERSSDLTSRRGNSDFAFIGDDQIQHLRKNSINYTQRVGQFLIRRDDLIPSVKERLKALIVGEDGLMVEPSDPDSEADQRLADHLQDVYEGDVRPTQVIDAILRENLMNARAVVRATDLAELDLRNLTYLKDGVTGEEIYLQRDTAVHTFDLDGGDDDSVGEIDVERKTIDEQPLIIGEQVFDVSLYDSPPLEAVADTAVNKMVMQRLKARKAEITSFGAVYASVEAPSYLPEDQYFDRVQDYDGDGDPPTKLERALKSNLQKAFDTLKDFQSGTVMAVPEYWSLEQLEIPDTGTSLDEKIRGYNRDIARRMLVPLDLIELREGAELSRDTLFRTLMTTIAGWRREILRIFDQFAQAQADVHDVPGDVEHSFPPLHNQETDQIIQALQYAGVAGLTRSEVRQMLNAIRGVDLSTEMDPVDDLGDLDDDGDQPAPDAPDDSQDPAEQAAAFLDERQQATASTDADWSVLADSVDDVDIELPTTCRICEDRTRMAGNFRCQTCHPDVDEASFDGELAASASIRASHELTGFDSVREAAHHVRRVVDRRIERGKTVEVERRSDGRFAVLVRGPDGGFRGSVLLQESDTDPDAVLVVGTQGILDDLRLNSPRGH